ncbi:protein of unknown function [Taphrina deformans PYCC 5710]|uniref:Acyltransferase 3 domain-containing protein n=1 Tax=Taphrina deformans (strain PYCC 5710 / ATCC 11124 / CBS 356.35 / IMI 108563 / JCM 9778 / NBRC 8474) TaxID=1097556 RepID=R4XF80_TAPDE|nr:protein of unknown function [Taphrina deformans PYCC 5710]|eukprot:CCG84313.1 protein of unknown function [Taphrina deformans PYCC 5710]
MSRDDTFGTIDQWTNTFTRKWSTPWLPIYRLYRSPEEDGEGERAQIATLNPGNTCLTSVKISSVLKPGLRPTAWLDGLRGLASFEVFIFHQTFNWGFTGAEGLQYGYYANKQTLEWWRLPYIRLFYGSGCFMVTIFFIISGFVLTQGLFKHIRARNYDNLMKNVSSAAIRRILRIWLPVIVTTLITFILVKLGVGSSLNRTGIPVQSTWIGQVRFWVLDMQHSMNPFSYRDRLTEAMNHHSKTAWTLPLEVYGSFVCYLMIVIMARISRASLRIMLIILAGAWAAWNSSWFLVLFFYGMLLADYDLGKLESKRPPIFTHVHNLLWVTVLAISLWVAGWAENFDPFIPNEMHAIWLLAASSCGTVTALYHLPTVRGLFESPAMQYLGKLSFGIYMVHFPVIDLLIEPYLRPFIAAWVGPSFSAQMLTFLCEVGIVLFLADLFERVIDTPSVRVAKTIETLLIGVATPDTSSTSAVLLPMTQVPESLGIKEDMSMEHFEYRA